MVETKTISTGPQIAKQWNHLNMQKQIPLRQFLLVYIYDFDDQKMTILQHVRDDYGIFLTNVIAYKSIDDLENLKLSTLETF